MDFKDVRRNGGRFFHPFRSERVLILPANEENLFQIGFLSGGNSESESPAERYAANRVSRARMSPGKSMR